MKIKGFHDDIEKQGSLVRDINKKKVADAFAIKKIKVSKDSSFKEYYEEKYDQDMSLDMEININKNPTINN